MQSFYFPLMFEWGSKKQGEILKLWELEARCMWKEPFCLTSSFFKVVFSLFAFFVTSHVTVVWKRVTAHISVTMSIPQLGSEPSFTKKWLIPIVTSKYVDLPTSWAAKSKLRVRKMSVTLITQVQKARGRRAEAWLCAWAIKYAADYHLFTHSFWLTGDSTWW